MAIRVGILGCANIAKRSLAPAFLRHPDFELCHVASRTPEKAKIFINDVMKVAAQNNTINPCSYEDLVEADDIDLIYCPLPTGLHYEWVKKCLLRDKHVLCEKSLACDYDEVRDLVEMARARQLFLMESFQFRCHPQNLFVRDILDKGRLGNIRQVVIRFGFPPFPDGEKNIRYHRELGGGALLDAGAYTIKAATFILGHQLQIVNATSWSGSGCLVDLGGTITLRTQDGRVAQTAYGFDNFYQCGYEIWCERGIIKTTRAFTAPPGFPAEVTVQTQEGAFVKTFPFDHFDALLTYVAGMLGKGCFDVEYDECLIQARLLSDVRNYPGATANG